MASMNQRLSLSLDSGADFDNNTGGVDELQHNDLSDTIFKSYLQITGQSSPDLSKIQTFLTSFRCICLERIQTFDPTWSCINGSFIVFGLLCIQSWAHQTSNIIVEQAVTRLFWELFPLPHSLQLFSILKLELSATILNHQSG
uniref:Uncharacterized protein n=1 Tax=Nelumbo nucifera TaxID=4432 RepID=A0A822Z0G7_NELNU|nr:TPA_asm: hypothetical protein HUJ06_007812 [Nelumbo nucifera]